MNSRLEKLIQIAEENNISDVLITNPKNMHYYSGFYNGEGFIIAGKNGFRLFTDSRYTEYAQKNCLGFDVCDISTADLSEYQSCTVGFEDTTISYKQYTHFSEKLPMFVPFGKSIDSMREIKDDTEIVAIKKALKIADDAFRYICEYITPGKTEKEIAAQIDCYMKQNGAESNSFPTIAAAGERGSLPHAMPTDRAVANGDMVVMDFGCVVDGYCSDITRTVAVGKISDNHKDVYNTVLEAQLTAIDKISNGVAACDVDKCARDIINTHYNGTFGHALGHSVGLDIHESPNLSPKNDSALKSGNVVTVEPGIYIPDFCGVRIEDMVVVRDHGCEILTESTKELITID